MADSVSSTDAKLLKKLGGVGLVMTIIFTISVSLYRKYIFALFCAVLLKLDDYYSARAFV